MPYFLFLSCFYDKRYLCSVVCFLELLRSPLVVWESFGFLGAAKPALSAFFLVDFAGSLYTFFFRLRSTFSGSLEPSPSDSFSSSSELESEILSSELLDPKNKCKKVLKTDLVLYQRSRYHPLLL